MLQVFQTIRKSFGSEISLNYDKMLTENALKKTKKKNEEKNENRKTRLIGLILHFTISPSYRGRYIAFNVSLSRSFLPATLAPERYIASALSLDSILLK